ncbi:putative superfamily III holin-X [Microbacteriaceae bacterium MWH-Ta3]|nr:putative superfamily III holin-X [Microbacteriaceae bacterium MWH-Ta3]
MSDTSSGRGFFRLLADLPRELSDLVRAEIRLLQTELADKLRHAGVGLGLVTIGAVLVSLFITMLVVALILGLAVFMPAWAAALTVAGIVLVAAAIFIASGIASIKKGFTPFESVDTIAKDFQNLGKGRDDQS